MPKAAFHTLGCKVNQYETEAVAEQFKKEGYEIVPFDAAADVYVINTCSVTGEAERKSLQAVRRAKRRNPQSTVVLTGCVAQVSTEEAAKAAGADIVLGNAEKRDIAGMVARRASSVADIMAQREYTPVEVCGHAGKTRAFIKIQEGCSNFCAYCIIPYARGPVRSREPRSVLDEARRLAKNGFKEIVLTGIHLSSYGVDLKGANLADILLMLHEIDGLERIRLGSLELAPVLYDIVDNADRLGRLCPHFHISLQSGCDQTLKRMRRRYTSAEYRRAVDTLREAFAGTAITTDIMVGFPGETREEFEQSLEFSRSIGFARCHIFKYSKRKGTPAATMPEQVDSAEKERRSHLMKQMAAESARRFMDGLVGKTVSVLFEQPVGSGEYEGYTPNYITVRVKSDRSLGGQVQSVRVTGVCGGYVTGVLV